MIILFIISYFLWAITGFICGVNYEYHTSTKKALKGWTDTLEAWNKDGEEWIKLLEKAKEQKNDKET